MAQVVCVVMSEYRLAGTENQATRMEPASQHRFQQVVLIRLRSEMLNHSMIVYG